MTLFRKTSLKKKMVLGGIVPLVLITALGMMSFESITALLDIGQKAEATNRMISDMSGIKNIISELENTEKNFLVTGNPKYLESFHGIKKKLAMSFADLNKKTDKELTARITEIEQLFDTWYQEAEKEIVARERIDMSPEERKALRETSGEPLELRVEQIIDPEVMRKIQKHYAGATGVASLVVEKDGSPLKLQTYDEFQEFCFGHQRKNKKGLELCMKSDAQGPQDAKKAGRAWYYCYSGGLIDFGFPITVDGEQIGNWLGGQILLETPDEAKFRKQAGEIGIEDVEGYIDALNNVPIVPEPKLEAAIELLKVISGTFGQMGNDIYLRNQLIDIVDQGAAADIMTQIRSALDGIRGTALGMLKAQQQSVERAAKITKQIITGGTIAAVLFTLLIAGGITWGILYQLGGEPARIEEIAQRVSEGDLDIDFDIHRGNETGVLAAMKKMVENLRGIIRDVKSASGSLANSSQELNSRSEEMSQGANEQAASAEEVSASMEEMAATIRQNSDNAMMTERIALQSAQAANEGRIAVDETLAAIQTIADKVSVIQEIARETNMLALNAAIESARAGTLGKGFAVVASEIRKLSEQTQKSSKNIMELTAAGVQVAENAGEALGKIAPDIQRTAELVQEINASSSEQNSGAGQINTAVQQLDQVIQKNAGISQEMASTAMALSGQAEHLRHVTEFFKVHDIDVKTDGDGDEASGDALSSKDIEQIRSLLAKLEGPAGPVRKESPGKSAMKKESVDIQMPDVSDSEFEVY